MVHTTLRYMASISGRAILAIGLTSATLLALTPSVKAEELIVTNPVFRNINSYTTAATAPVATASGVNAVVGSLNVSSNDVFVIKASGTGSLTGSNGDVASYTLAVGTGTGSATATAVSGTPATFYTGSATEAKDNMNLDLTVASTVNFQKLRAGTFSETVTLTIAGS